MHRTVVLQLSIIKQSETHMLPGSDNALLSLRAGGCAGVFRRHVGAQRACAAPDSGGVQSPLLRQGEESIEEIIGRHSYHKLDCAGETDGEH